MAGTEVGVYLPYRPPGFCRNLQEPRTSDCVTKSRRWDLLWTELHLPRNAYAEVPVTNVPVFGERAFVEVTKDKRFHKGGAWIQRKGVLLRRDTIQPV